MTVSITYISFKYEINKQLFLFFYEKKCFFYIIIDYNFVIFINDNWRPPRLIELNPRKSSMKRGPSISGLRAC